MFVKIKLEPQSTRSTLKKNTQSTYFEIGDNTTLAELKKKIEQHVDVPAERQQIRTLTESFDGRDSAKIQDICKIQEVKDTSVWLLHAYDEFGDYEETTFVCFLQIYNNELGLRQQEMEKRVLSNPKMGERISKACGSTASMGTLVIESETDSPSDTDTSQSDSQSECSSSSENSSSCQSFRGTSKKRQKDLTPENKPKRLKSTPVIDKPSPTLCQYLDEFPKCNDLPTVTIDNRGKTDSNVEDASSAKRPIDDRRIYEDEEDAAKANSTSIPPGEANVVRAPAETPKLDDNSPDNKKLKNISDISSTTTDVRHPCHDIAPENRQFMLVLSKSDPISKHSQCEILLDWFFDQFQRCESSDQLQFNKDAFTLFEGNIWISCLNKNTYDWVTSCLEKFHETFIIGSLNRGILCEVVIPIISNSKKLLDIFDLLEKQNPNLSTLQWCVTNRKILSPEENSKSVSSFCTNELFTIIIDKMSMAALKTFNLRLKYCFWQIEFIVL
ncbi:uncharacterized protein LOC106081560 [Stomoxys calcitrans]|uniref:uncharacterized protein LOC106081560 n=1 Tax=Stomoxys calcitrans TaxID=35570 RepID=UPI0027E2466B|nr:uncharacterized protein LOC106081560 [Stomoxys calcitrans]